MGACRHRSNGGEVQAGDMCGSARAGARPARDPTARPAAEPVQRPFCGERPGARIEDRGVRKGSALLSELRPLTQRSLSRRVHRHYRTCVDARAARNVDRQRSARGPDEAIRTDRKLSFVRDPANPRREPPPPTPLAPVRRGSATTTTCVSPSGGANMSRRTMPRAPTTATRTLRGSSLRLLGDGSLELHARVHE